MTEPHDLAYFQVSGIGLQLSERFYDKNIYKSYPRYEYHEVLKAMENINKKNNMDKIGVPISSIHCYFEQLTPLGGMLRDFYRNYTYSMQGNSSGKKIGDQLEKELFEKLKAFSTSFKDWQRSKKERCKSCYMTYLFCKHTKNRDEKAKNEKKEK
jgi:hypothetical protein